MKLKNIVELVNENSDLEFAVQDPFAYSRHGQDARRARVVSFRCEKDGTESGTGRHLLVQYDDGTNGTVMPNMLCATWTDHSQAFKLRAVA